MNTQASDKWQHVNNNVADITREPFCTEELFISVIPSQCCVTLWMSLVFLFTLYLQAQSHVSTKD